MFKGLFGKNKDYKDFTLMYKNEKVADISTQDDDVVITKMHNADKFPTAYQKEDMVETTTCLKGWLKFRCIPNARLNIGGVLKKLGLDSTWKLSCAALGVSLNDQYWYKPKMSSLSWESINPYKNGFSSDLGDILFDPTKNTINVDIVSPDATTHGVDAKRWILDENNNAYLIKTSVNYQQVACNEKLASEICRRLGINAVNYEILESKLMGDGKFGDCYNEKCLFAVSKNFCDENHLFVTAHNYRNNFLRMREKEFVQDILLSNKFKQDIGKMVVLDFLISNEDRHYNNFGFLIDDTGNVELAPIYDNGNSMFYASNDSDIGYTNGYSSIAPTYKEAMELLFAEPSDFDWYDPTALTGISSFFAEITKNTDLSPERQQKLCEYLDQRVLELNNYIEQFKANYRDIDEIISEFYKKDNSAPLGYKIENGQVVLTNEKAIEEYKHLIKTKQIQDVKQYPAYVNSRNIER